MTIKQKITKMIWIAHSTPKNIAIPENAPSPRMTKNTKNSIFNRKGMMKNKLTMKKSVKMISSNMSDYQRPVFSIDTHWSLGNSGSPFPLQYFVSVLVL